MVRLNRCHECGQTFEAVRYDARKCSNSCRARAVRKWHAERQRESAALLADMTAALTAGADEGTLAELRRRAERLNH